MCVCWYIHFKEYIFNILVDIFASNYRDISMNMLMGRGYNII